MSGRRNIFTQLRQLPSKDAGGISGKSSATGVGTICVQLANRARVRLQDAFHVPSMTATLVSSACLFSTNGFTTVFGAHGSILDRNPHVVASASRQPPV